MKRFAAFLLALSLVVFGLSLSVAEEEKPEEFTSGDFTYVVMDDGTAKIVRYSGNDVICEIPAQLDGYSVTSIGDLAFDTRAKLKSVTIPDSVVSVGVNPFIDCVELKDIIVSQDHPALAVIDGVLFSKADKRLVSFPEASWKTEYAIPQGIKMIGDGAFFNCSGLTSIIIPESVTNIGASAFAFCKSLSSVSIPENVASIEDGAFYNCSGLTSITIPENVTSIGNGAFNNCSSLISIMIPNGVTSINNETFYGCKSLSSIKIPDSVVSIGDFAFVDCSSLSSIKIPDSVVSIGDLAFVDCSSLTSITIPDSVTNIGVNPFRRCSGLAEVIIAPDHPAFEMKDNSLISKADKRLIFFMEPSEETEYVIPQGVQVIGGFAFDGCSNVTTVTIPDSVTSIGDYAFSCCFGLLSITIPDSVTSIGSYLFYSCFRLKTVTIPDSVTSIGKSVLAGSDLAICTVGRNSYAKQYCEENGIKYTYADALDWLND